MSGWLDVDLSTVSTVVTPVAEGEYTFELLPGAKFSDYDPSKIECQAAIVEGEFAGRRIYFSYPDPAKFEWSPRILKRFVEQLGVETEAGESAIQTLNRAAGLRFQAPVNHRKSGEEGAPPKADLNIFKIRPAA